MSSTENMEVQNTDPDLNKCEKIFEGKEMSSCFAMIYMKLENSIASVQTQVNQLDERVTNLETYRNFTESAIRTLQEETIVKLEEKIQGERIERLKLENWGRKWNLITRGIPGVLKENARVTESTVRNFFRDKLSIPETTANTIILQAAHRLPSGDESKRNIIVRFNSLIDRDEVLQKAMKLRPGTGVSITPDLAPETSKLRSQLLQERAQLSPEERRKSKLIYIKQYPFVKLVTRK